MASGQPAEAVVTGVTNLGLLTSESHLVFKAGRGGELHEYCTPQYQSYSNDRLRPASGLRVGLFQMCFVGDTSPISEEDPLCLELSLVRGPSAVLSFKD